jgi:hypothetical protein
VNEGPSEATRGEGREREFLPWLAAVGEIKGEGVQHQFVIRVPSTSRKSAKGGPRSTACVENHTHAVGPTARRCGCAAQKSTLEGVLVMDVNVIRQVVLVDASTNPLKFAMALDRVTKSDSNCPDSTHSGL